jgi:hypothetical protein
VNVAVRVLLGAIVMDLVLIAGVFFHNSCPPTKI